MPHQESGDNMEPTEIAEFMGTVTAELQNGNRLMEQLRQGQEALKADISGIKSDVQVMKASTDLKRKRCEEIFEEHATKIVDLDDKSRRDKIMIDDLERRQTAASVATATTKEIRAELKDNKKDKREISAWQMGMVLGAIQIASFIFMLWWKQ